MRASRKNVPRKCEKCKKPKPPIRLSRYKG